jgi:integrase
LIGKATAGQKQQMLWDALVTGLGVRILPGGSKTYWFQYRPPGGRAVSARMVRIGASPTIKLDQARKVARDIAGQVARGADPAAERQKAKRRISVTLGDLLAADGEYERHLQRRHIVNTKTIMSGLNRGLARLKTKDVKDISRRDYVVAVAAIEDQGKPGAAEDLRKFSRMFCEWCVSRGLVTANVLAGLRRPKQTRAEKLAAGPRKAGALTDAEIVAVWNACEGRGSFGGIIRLLLLTGGRRGEIAKLTWEQIKSDRLVLPPLATKSGEKHEVPLTDLMRGVIAVQPHTTGNLVFPSEKSGGQVQGWSKLVPKLQRDSGVEFTPHDLRRTCRTLMTHYRVDHDVAELAIGHRRHGLDRLYNFAQLWDLRRDAFEKVSGHVAGLINPAKVVPLTRPQGPAPAPPTLVTIGRRTPPAAGQQLLGAAAGVTGRAGRTGCSG